MNGVELAAVVTELRRLYEALVASNETLLKQAGKVQEENAELRALTDRDVGTIMQLRQENERLRGEVFELRSNVNASWRIERERCLAIAKAHGDVDTWNEIDAGVVGCGDK